MGVRLTSTFNDEHGGRWKIDIHDSDYSSSASEFTVGGDGFTLSYDGKADDLLDPIIGSSLEFTFYEENNTHESALDIISTAEEGRFTVEITKDPDGSPAKYWVGVVLPEMVSRPDVYWPRPTTISATCDLGNLKNIDFNNDGTSYTGKESMRVILLECLRKVRTTTTHWGTSTFDVFLSLCDGIYADNQSSTSLSNHRINQSLFRNPDDNGTPRYFSTYEVLKSIAITYNARIFLADGHFWFVPVSQYQNNAGNLVRFGYRRTGGSATVATSLTANVNQGSTFKRLSGGRETHLPALKRVHRSMDTLAVHPIVADQDLDPYSTTTLTDDGRVYSEGQVLIVGGQFVYNWQDGHSGAVPSNLFDQIAAFEIRFTIKVGAKYLTRTATYNASTNYNATGNAILEYFLPEYGEDTWTTSAGYYPIVWGEFANLYAPPVVRGDAFTFSFTIPEDLTGLELSVDIVGRDDQGNLFAAAIDGDGTTAPVIQFLNMAVYYGGDQIPTQVEFRATSAKNSRHSIDQGTVLFGDTIGDVTLGELEVYTGSEWTTPDTWVVSGLEFETAASSGFIHKVGVDEVLRMRLNPVKVWEADWRGSVDFHLWNTLFFDSTYWLPLSHKFEAQTGTHSLVLWKVQRNNVADDTEIAEVDVVFNDDPRNGKGAGFGKPQTTLEGERLDRMRDVGATNGDLSDVQADVDTNTGAIAEVESDVATLQGDVGTANSNISTNSNNISTLDTGLSTLQKKIEGENLDKLGVFSDITDDTLGSIKVTTQSAILRAGNRTAIEATQTSPGSLQFKVQAGASGSEAEVTALTISGDSSVNTKANISTGGGSFRVNGTALFNQGVSFASGQTATFSGTTSGIDYNDLDNLPQGAPQSVNYARMSMSSAVLRGGASEQDFTGITDVTVKFDTEDDNDGGELTTNTTTHRVTVSSDGLYRLTVNMSFYSTSARATPAVRFNLNGSTIDGESMGYIRAASGNNEASANLTRVIYLSANDYIEVCCHDESSATGSIFAEEALFEVEKLGGVVGPAGADGTDGADGTNGSDGADGLGFTGGSYDSGTGVVTFTSNDGLGFSTGDLRGADGTDGIDGDPGADGVNGTNGVDGADGLGFTGGSYDAGTGVVTFTSDDGLGFTTGDLRGADGADGVNGADGADGSDALALGGNDQTLTADRTIDGGGSHDLIVHDVSEFKVTTSADATAFAVTPGAPSTVQVNGNFSVDSAQVTGGSIRLEEANLLGSNYIELKAPISITSNVTLTFPDGAGSSGQVLQTNGSGTLTWTDKLGQTNPVVKGALTIERVTVGNVPRLYIKGEDNLGGVFLKAPEAIATDVTFQLPESDGTSGQVLQTDGSGNLSFTDATAFQTFHDVGRRQWSSSQDNHYHFGDATFGQNDTGKSLAYSTLSGTNRGRQVLVNTYFMTTAVTNVDVRGFVAHGSSGYDGEDLDIIIVKVTNVQSNDATLTTLGTISVTTADDPDYVTSVSGSVTGSVAAGEGVLMVYRFPNAVIGSTSYLYTSLTIQCS